MFNSIKSFFSDARDTLCKYLPQGLTQNASALLSFISPSTSNGLLLDKSTIAPAIYYGTNIVSNVSKSLIDKLTETFGAHSSYSAMNALASSIKTFGNTYISGKNYDFINTLFINEIENKPINLILKRANLTINIATVESETLQEVGDLFKVLFPKLLLSASVGLLTKSALNDYLSGTALEVIAGAVGTASSYTAHKIYNNLHSEGAHITDGLLTEGALGALNGSLGEILGPDASAAQSLLMGSFAEALETFIREGGFSHIYTTIAGKPFAESVAVIEDCAHMDAIPTMDNALVPQELPLPNSDLAII